MPQRARWCGCAHAVRAHVPAAAQQFGTHSLRNPAQECCSMCSTLPVPSAAAACAGGRQLWMGPPQLLCGRVPVHVCLLSRRLHAVGATKRMQTAKVCCMRSLQTTLAAGVHQHCLDQTHRPQGVNLHELATRECLSMHAPHTHTQQCPPPLRTRCRWQRQLRLVHAQGTSSACACLARVSRQQQRCVPAGQSSYSRTRAAVLPVYILSLLMPGVASFIACVCVVSRQRVGLRGARSPGNMQHMQG
jgi:hypothetical protein